MSQSSVQVHAQDDRASLRNPVLDDNAHISIPLVVIIPIIVTIILCVIASCVYRYRKKRAIKTPNDQHPTPRVTMFQESKTSPFMMEELPPSYEVISETKKDLSFVSETKNMHEKPPPPYSSNPVDPSKSLNEN